MASMTKPLAVLAIASAALLASCSDGSEVKTSALTTTAAAQPVATSCTRDAQASIFRPADFSTLASRSVLVVVGHVVAQSVDVVNVGPPETPQSFQVTWVDSTFEVETVVFTADTVQRHSRVVVRTMAEGRTCDRLDALPLKDQRYVMFLDKIDDAPEGAQRYFTVGGSWSGRLTVDGEAMHSDAMEWVRLSPAATQVATRKLSDLVRDIAAARQPH